MNDYYAEMDSFGYNGFLGLLVLFELTIAKILTIND
jgi:hypothetical protein